MRLSKTVRKPIPRRAENADNPLHPWGVGPIRMREQCALATVEQLKAEWEIAGDRAGFGDNPFAGFAMSDIIAAELRSRRTP